MTNEVEEIIVSGLNPNDVIYPLLISLYGETKKGKTYFGASFPNAVVMDFAITITKFKEAFPDPISQTRNVGEGFRSLFSPTTRNGKVGWIPKIDGFNYNTQYKYIKDDKGFLSAIEDAKLFSESLLPSDGKAWVVIDDTTRWRGIELIEWRSKNSGKWPIPAQFGQITQTMQSKLTEIQEFANVLLISRMVKNFDTGDYGPQVYPTGSDYLADASLEICEEIGQDKKIRQVIKVHSNGHNFACNDDYCSKIENPTPIDVLMALKIPRELW